MKKALDEPVMAENVFYFGQIPLAQYGLPSSMDLVEKTSKYFLTFIDLVLFFIIPLLTYAVIRIPICLCSYYKDEVEKNERNSNWIETSGTITGIVHYDRIRTKIVGRKWRRRTKFIKVTHEKLEYEYRDMYGYKHDGRVTFEKSPSPDWENGKVELIDIDPNAKEIKVYYDPKRTAYSRLNADGTDNSYIIIIILHQVII